MQWIIESYDGMASMRTINPADGEIEISICPGCEEEIFSLINHLKEEDGLFSIKIGGGKKNIIEDSATQER